MTLVLCLLTLTSLVPVGPPSANATSSSVNIIANPSFENGVDSRGVPVNWGFEPCEGVANATVSIDTGLWIDGYNSVKVFTGPVTQSGCFGPISGRQVGFIQFRQFLLPGLTFSNLTDAPNGFSFWFYLEPYGNGTMGGFEVRIFGAESLAELDYVFDPNPFLASGYPNYTDPATGKEGFRALLFYGYQPGQWYHFSRNLRADWANLGFNMTRSFSLVQFEGVAISNGGTVQSETFWLDDVRVYTGTEPPPIETHYALFNFTDYNGNNVDNIVKWKLLNATGQEVAYTLGQNTLPTGPYFVEAYYRAYGQANRILREQIHLDTRLNIPLAMFPNNSLPGGYIALDNPVASTGVDQPYSTRLRIIVQGTAGTIYSMIVDVPKKPVLIQGNGADLAEGFDWRYDATLSVARISFTLPPDGENVTILFEAPLRIPDLSFVDVAGSSLQSKITFKIIDSQGNPVPYTVGSILPPGSFYVEAYFAGYRIYKSSLGNIGTIPVTLEMVPLAPSRDSYLALNSTTTTVTLSEFSSSRIAFKVEGQGPYMIVMNVPKRPLYVEKDGVRTPSWLYNGTSQTVAIETNTQGSFQIVLEETPSYTSLYIGGAVAGLATAAILGRVLWRRRTRIPTSHEARRQQLGMPMRNRNSCKTSPRGW